ncbi:MAG: hypothetical protein ACI8PT_004176, partial [Gammaproteobacteria bacterium]
MTKFCSKRADDYRILRVNFTCGQLQAGEEGARGASLTRKNDFERVEESTADGFRRLARGPTRTLVKGEQSVADA